MFVGFSLNAMILCANDAWYSQCTGTVYVCINISKFDEKAYFIFQLRRTG